MRSRILTFTKASPAVPPIKEKSTLRCPACEGNSLRARVRLKEYSYLACRRCGTGQLAPMPSPELAAMTYGEGYFLNSKTGGYADYEADEPVHRLNAHDRLKLLKLSRMPAAGDPPRLLDYGCAHGFFLDEARRAGWGVAGVEISSHARDIARRRFALDVHEKIGSFHRRLREQLDAVTFFQCLEHLRDPVEALVAARECLVPGGQLVIETWDFESRVARLSGRFWQQLTPVSVLWLFTRRGLPLLLERTGYRDVHVRRSAKRIRMGFAARILAAKHPLLFGVPEKLLIWTGLEKLTIRYALGDLITAVASRR